MNGALVVAARHNRRMRSPAQRDARQIEGSAPKLGGAARLDDAGQAQAAGAAQAPDRSGCSVGSGELGVGRAPGTPRAESFDADGRVRVMPGPCPSCPWRVDQDGTRIPGFSMELAEALGEASTHDLNARLFACHMSPEHRPLVCASWLTQVGPATSIRLRIMIAWGQLDTRYLRRRSDWPRLHDTWAEVLTKLKNGPLGHVRRRLDHPNPRPRS
ncbi:MULTISPECIES: DUF6283 family protein [unclassified Conexibacter]|uniref:DUF6283 family protein n=1 Tax=unclassified Conexibacter TaxID=2627773 RepID=UPI00351C9F20